LLADLITLRNLYDKSHWQGAGPAVCHLQLLFDKHCKEQAELVDSLAEWNQLLGGVTIGMADVAELTLIPRPARSLAVRESQLSRLVEAHLVVMVKTRRLLHCAIELGDEDINDFLIGEVLHTNELQVWFLSEHLDKHSCALSSAPTQLPSVV